MGKLISCTDFIEQSRYSSDISPFGDEQDEIELKELHKIYRYARFLKQPLKLEMFIPCDDKGNVLEKPENYSNFKDYTVGQLPEQFDKWCNECHEYQKAQEKVLFKNINIHGIEIYIDDGNIEIFLGYKSNLTKQYNYLEDLIPFNLELTNSAIKQLKHDNPAGNKRKKDNSNL